MANPITGFQLAQQGTNLSASSSAAKPAASRQSSKSSKSNKVARIYRYPLERMLHDYTDYIKITSLAYKPPGIGELNSTNFVIPTSDTNYRSINKQNILGTVILPIPQTIPNNSQSASWGEGKLSALTVAGLNIAQEGITNPQSPFVGLYEGISGAVEKILSASKTGRGQKAFETFFSAKAIQQLTGQDVFTEVLARETGAVINENVELLFRGVNLREAFTLNFDLAPRGDKEAQEIRNMVLFLKHDMSPRKGTESGAAGGIFITAPNVFKIEYMSGNKNHPYLNRFKICALQGLSLNFTASNTYTTYSDGTPVHMNLSLTFQELTPIYAEDYETSEGTSGVGY